MLEPPETAGAVEGWPRPIFTWLTAQGDNISIIDPAFHRVAGEIHASKDPHGIVPWPDGKRFYVGSETENVLEVVDRVSHSIIRRVPIGRLPTTWPFAWAASPG